jgi:diacylglycerol O-acyltransferase
MSEPAPRPLRMAPHMSDAEALMWTLEKDPVLRSSFLQLTILDRPPDLDRLRRRMDRATRVIPRLRERVVSGPARIGPPRWSTDPTFDLAYHVRHLAVPPPGTLRQLLDLAAAVYDAPFDRARPLWEMAVVEGLEGGRAALLVKMHHTITDGVGGVRLSMEFLDLARDAAEPPPVPAPAPTPAPRGLALVGAAAGHLARRQLGAARRLVAGGLGLASHPDRLPRLAAEAAATAASVARQALVTDPARSPLWRGRATGSHRFEALGFDLDAVRRAAKALGGTVNDLFVTAVAGGAGAYHARAGEPVAELRMAMPINRRDDRSAGGNAFSPSRVVVPVAGDAVARFAAVRDRLGRVKREPALRVAEGVAGALNVLPVSLLVRLARQQAATVDFATSNLRGAPFDLYIAGAEVLANHPMGPTAGVAFNATVMSYRDRFDVGLNTDAGAVDDPELLARCIADAFDELLAYG